MCSKPTRKLAGLERVNENFVGLLLPTSESSTTILRTKSRLWFFPFLKNSRQVSRFFHQYFPFSYSTFLAKARAKMLEKERRPVAVLLWF